MCACVCIAAITCNLRRVKDARMKLKHPHLNGCKLRAVSKVLSLHNVQRSLYRESTCCGETYSGMTGFEHVWNMRHIRTHSSVWASITCHFGQGGLPQEVSKSCAVTRVGGWNEELFLRLFCGSCHHTMDLLLLTKVSVVVMLFSHCWFLCPYKLHLEIKLSHKDNSGVRNDSWPGQEQSLFFSVKSNLNCEGIKHKLQLGECVSLVKTFYGKVETQGRKVFHIIFSI